MALNPTFLSAGKIFSKCRPDRASRWSFVDIYLSKLSRSP
jgi:hypothetical protein